MLFKVLFLALFLAIELFLALVWALFKVSLLSLALIFALFGIFFVDTFLWSFLAVPGESLRQLYTYQSD